MHSLFSDGSRLYIVLDKCGADPPVAESSSVQPEPEARVANTSAESRLGRLIQDMEMDGLNPGSPELIGEDEMMLDDGEDIYHSDAMVSSSAHAVLATSSAIPATSSTSEDVAPAPAASSSHSSASAEVVEGDHDRDRVIVAFVVDEKTLTATSDGIIIIDRETNGSTIPSKWTSNGETVFGFHNVKWTGFHVQEWTGMSHCKGMATKQLAQHTLHPALGLHTMAGLSLDSRNSTMWFYLRNGEYMKFSCPLVPKAAFLRQLDPFSPQFLLPRSNISFLMQRAADASTTLATADVSLLLLSAMDKILQVNDSSSFVTEVSLEVLEELLDVLATYSRPYLDSNQSNLAALYDWSNIHGLVSTLRLLKANVSAAFHSTGTEVPEQFAGEAAVGCKDRLKAVLVALACHCPYRAAMSTTHTLTMVRQENELCQYIRDTAADIIACGVFWLYEKDDIACLVRDNLDHVGFCSRIMRRLATTPGFFLIEDDSEATEVEEQSGIGMDEEIRSADASPASPRSPGAGPADMEECDEDNFLASDSPSPEGNEIEGHWELLSVLLDIFEIEWRHKVVGAASFESDTSELYDAAFETYSSMVGQLAVLRWREEQRVQNKGAYSIVGVANLLATSMAGKRFTRMATMVIDRALPLLVSASLCLREKARNQAQIVEEISSSILVRSVLPLVIYSLASDLRASTGCSIPSPTAPYFITESFLVHLLKLQRALQNCLKVVDSTLLQEMQTAFDNVAKRIGDIDNAVYGGRCTIQADELYEQTFEFSFPGKDYILLRFSQASSVCRFRVAFLDSEGQALAGVSDQRNPTTKLKLSESVDKEILFLTNTVTAVVSGYADEDEATSFEVLAIGFCDCSSSKSHPEAATQPRSDKLPTLLDLDLALSHATATISGQLASAAEAAAESVPSAAPATDGSIAVAPTEADGQASASTGASSLQKLDARLATWLQRMGVLSKGRLPPQVQRSEFLMQLMRSAAPASVLVSRLQSSYPPSMMRGIRDPGNKKSIEKAMRAVYGAMLYHTGLVAEAEACAADVLIGSFQQRSGADNNSDPIPEALRLVWNKASAVVGWMIEQRQLGGDSSIYLQLSRKIIERTEFLLELCDATTASAFEAQVFEAGSAGNASSGTPQAGRLALSRSGQYPFPSTPGSPMRKSSGTVPRSAFTGGRQSRLKQSLEGSSKAGSSSKSKSQPLALMSQTPMGTSSKKQSGSWKSLLSFMQTLSTIRHQGELSSELKAVYASTCASVMSFIKAMDVDIATVSATLDTRDLVRQPPCPSSSLPAACQTIVWLPLRIILC